MLSFGDYLPVPDTTARAIRIAVAVTITITTRFGFGLGFADDHLLGGQNSDSTTSAISGPMDFALPLPTLFIGPRTTTVEFDEGLTNVFTPTPAFGHITPP